MKKNVNYFLTENVKEKFKMTAFLLNRSESQIIEELMIDFIIKNKAEVNEILLKKIHKSDENNSN